MKLLLLSNSTNKGEQFLGYPEPEIKRFLGPEIKRVLFFPYAGVTISFDRYADLVAGRMSDMGYESESIHRMSDPVTAIDNAEAIVIGGGNTFHLLTHLYKSEVIDRIHQRVTQAGIPYIGWSAGSNVACPTIRTTNDMPIIEPPSLKAINLVPFQINAHYSDFVPEGHRGETRDERLREFTIVNPEVTIIGLREGTMLELADHKLRLIGKEPARIFRGDEPVREMGNESDLDEFRRK
jgi:dipeptidase E